MSPSSLNIVIVHAQAAHCEALCDFVADQVGFRIIAGSASGPEAVDLMRVASVHVLILDLESLADDAVDVIASARAASPGTGILLLAHRQPAALLDALMLRGATGYLRTERIGPDMAAALRTIGRGRRYLPPAPVETT